MNHCSGTTSRRSSHKRTTTNAPVISSTRPHSPSMISTSSSRIGCVSRELEAGDDITQYRTRGQACNQSSHTRRGEQAGTDLTHAWKGHQRTSNTDYKYEHHQRASEHIDLRCNRRALQVVGCVRQDFSKVAMATKCADDPQPEPGQRTDNDPAGGSRDARRRRVGQRGHGECSQTNTAAAPITNSHLAGRLVRSRRRKRSDSGPQGASPPPT